MSLPIPIDELKSIGRREYHRIGGENVEPVWLEAKGDFCVTMDLVLIEYRFESLMDKDAKDLKFYATYFGSDLDERFLPEEYRKTWRCWYLFDKPSEKDRKEVSWSE